MGVLFYFSRKIEINPLQPSFFTKNLRKQLTTRNETLHINPHLCLFWRSVCSGTVFLSSICTKTMQTFVLKRNVKKCHAFILQYKILHLVPHSPSTTTSIPLTSLTSSLIGSSADIVFLLLLSSLTPGMFHA